MGALVEPLALGAERQLTGPDQDVVEPRVSIKGEVQRAWTLRRPLAGREREQEQMRVAADHRGLGECHVVGTGLEKRTHRGLGLRLDAQRHRVRTEEQLNRFGQLGQIERGGLGRDQQRDLRFLRPTALAGQRACRRAASAEDRRALAACPYARR